MGHPAAKCVDTLMSAQFLGQRCTKFQ
jgi:hypothetical protein